MIAVLQIKQSQREARVPVTVFELEGELESSTYEKFQTEAMQAVEAGAQYILLDLGQLTYISSAGLRALYALSKTLSAKGGKPAGKNGSPGIFKSPYLKLLNPTQNVRQALDVMGFTMSMEIHSDFNTALASF